MNWKQRSLSAALSRVPSFRGKGRLTLFCDRFATDYSNPNSYSVVGNLNGSNRFQFDLRAWGQKFAFYYQQWELPLISCLRSLYAGGDFVDIGSSLGLYVVSLGDLVRSNGARIVSVEPVGLNVEKQRVNIELNGIRDLVEIHQVGLSNEEKMSFVKTDPERADNNAFIAPEGDTEIQVTTMDKLLAGYERNIGLIKIDVEGYEPMVIRGALSTLSKFRPVILAEFNRERMAINGFSIDESWDILVGRLSYRCFRLDLSGKPRLLHSPGEFQDLFFIPDHVPVPNS